MSGSGRGGQPPKIVPRTKGGWTGEKPGKDFLIGSQITVHVMNAIEKAGAPREMHAQAHRIMREHHRAMQVFDNPLATKDKNKAGVGKYKLDLRKRAEKMANQLDKALADEASHDLNGIILDGDLRSHMLQAYMSLSDMVVLIDRAQEGETPLQSMAEVKLQTGAKLKALAKKHNIPPMNFVFAFKLYVTDSHESFETWYHKLGG